MTLKACTFGGFHLIVVDLSEGLPLPNVSSPPNNISSCNVVIHISCQKG